MVNLTLFLFSILIKTSFFIFSGLREKQDKVDFGNDREDNIIEDLHTLTALYDKIKSNVNSLNQWVSILSYLGNIHILCQICFGIFNLSTLPYLHMFLQIPIRHIFVIFLSMSELLNLSLFFQGKEESIWWIEFVHHVLWLA